MNLYEDFSSDNMQPNCGVDFKPGSPNAGF